MGNLHHLNLAQQLERYREYFPGPHLDMVLASMLAGNTAGELHVIAPDDNSPLLLLWDKGNNVFYLAGDPQASSIESLAAAIASDIRPRAEAEGVGRFKTRALSTGIEERLPELFPATSLRSTRTLFYVQAARELPVPSTGVAGVTFAPITRDILTSDGVAGTGYVLEEIQWMWPSEDRFYDRGFGVVAILDGEIIGWCTSEYVSPAQCGIGIETSSHHEGRGIATAMTVRFIEEARKRGITACWECDSTNHASARVAEKTGFVLESEETYWIGSFK